MYSRSHLVIRIKLNLFREFSNDKKICVSGISISCTREGERDREKEREMKRDLNFWVNIYRKGYLIYYLRFFF